jgi:hypothetical protein
LLGIFGLPLFKKKRKEILEILGFLKCKYRNLLIFYYFPHFWSVSWGGGGINFFDIKNLEKEIPPKGININNSKVKYK